MAELIKQPTFKTVSISEFLGTVVFHIMFLLRVIRYIYKVD